MWPQSEPAESFHSRSQVGRYRLRVRARFPEDCKYILRTLVAQGNIHQRRVKRHLGLEILDVLGTILLFVDWDDKSRERIMQSTQESRPFAASLL